LRNALLESIFPKVVLPPRLTFLMDILTEQWDVSFETSLVIVK
jgi:hypothetical protein